MKISARITHVIVLLALFLGSYPIQIVHAANEWIVTNINDSGDGSLRQAIENSTNGDIIQIAATLSGQTITLGADLGIGKDLTIRGPSQIPQVIISGSGAFSLAVSEDAIVEISDLTITDCDDSGIISYGVLTLENTKLLNNDTSRDGGGIEIVSGTVTISNSLISENSADYGGGIYVYTGTVYINNSIISNNDATGYGGGVINLFGTVNIENSTFSSNTASQGGGIFNTGSLNISQGIFSENNAEVVGGGIYRQAGSLSIENSIFSNNSSSTAGGLYNKGDLLNITNTTFSGNFATYTGGGILNNDNSTLTITKSTFANNAAGDNLSSGNGGGILNLGIISVTNSTFSNNSAGDTGSSIQNTDNAEATITNSTFSDNSNANGSVYNQADMTITNSIITQNGTNADCVSLLGNFSANNNIMTNPEFACGLVNGANGNIIGIAPLLGTLADNGGSTQSIPLLPGSPAINKGNPDFCPAADQRGIARPQGSGCDIGAYEVDTPIVGYFNLLDPNPTATSTVNYSISFSMPVKDVDVDDFVLTTTGVIGASVNDVLGSGEDYTVTINTGTNGPGTIRLDLKSSATITDLSNNPLMGIPFTNGGIYTINRNIPSPSIPLLVYPANNALLTNYAPRLDWSNSSLPAGTTFEDYQVQVDDNDSFTSPDVDLSSISGNIFVSEITLTADLLPNTKYYWRVRSINTAKVKSAWSIARVFRTALLPPELLEPVNWINPLSLRPTFSWSDPNSNGTQGYKIQISKYDSFSTILLTSNPTSTSFTPLTSLPAGAALYWRVQTLGVNGPSLWSEIRAITSPAPPSTPVLVSPLNNSLITSYTPTLNWKAVILPAGTNFRYYQIQVSAELDPAFSSPIIDDASITNPAQVQFPISPSLDPNAKYYWRVRAVNNNSELGVWSPTWSFRTVLLPPILSEPINDGASSIRSLRPTLTWSNPNPTGVTGYNIQISKYSNLSSPILSASSTTSTYTPVSNLPANTVLYWRVQAKGINGPSLWSSPTWAFKTSNPSSIPVLSAPANGLLTTSFIPTFSWKPSTFPAGTSLLHYQIQISTNKTFSSNIIDQTTTNTQYVSEITLDPNTSYSWHVRAVNSNNEPGGWSATWSMRTHLEAPTLLTPESNATPSTLRPTFDWNDVFGASKYTIQISTSNTFASILMSASPINSIFVPAKDLPVNSILYWRVQALGTNGPSTWTQQQITSADPPSISLLISPRNININSYEPTLTWSTSTNNAAYYQVQISKNSSFTNLILDTNTNVNHYRLPANTLENLTKYYWRVRSANNLDQISNWSTLAWFLSPGQISGRITNSVGGSGTGGIIIQVKGKNLSGTTDSNGNYTIKGVMPGSYTLLATTGGYRYKPASFLVSLSSSNLTGKNFLATVLQSVSGTVVLDPRSQLTIQGLRAQTNDIAAVPDFGFIDSNSLISFPKTNVLDPIIKFMLQGLPVQNSNVFDLSNSGVIGVTVKDNQGNVTSTDASGNYVINNAVTGSYSLNLTKSGYSSIPISRSFFLSDDALSQYFMITPLLKPSTILVYPTNRLNQSSFSENGRFLFIPDNTGGLGVIMDLYTGQQISGAWAKGELSGSGRFVTYSVAGLPVVNWGVFGMDRDTDNNGIFDEPGNVDTWTVSEGVDWSRISTDGRYIVAGGGGACGSSLSIYDVQMRTTICSSTLATGFWPEISPNGRFIIFNSWYELVPEDTNSDISMGVDVYVYDRDTDNNGIFDETGQTKLDLVSVATNGQNSQMGGVKASAAPTMSGNGRWLVFQSRGLDPSSPDDVFNGIYLRDRQNRTTIKLKPNLLPVAGCIKVYFDPDATEITPDGRFVLVNGGVNCKYGSNTSDINFLGNSSYLLDRDVDQDGIFDEIGYTIFNKIDLLFTNKYLECSNLSADGRYCLFVGGGYAPGLPEPGVYIHDRGTNLSFSITGRVTDGANNPVSGVSIDAGNGRMAFTDVNGFYSLLGMPGGTYYLKASGNGLTYSPSERAVVVPPNSTGQDFKTTTGYVQLSSLSGRVTDLYNNPIVDVVMDAGNGYQTSTDNEGFYLFSGLPDGQYTLTPTKDGYEFHPQPFSYNIYGEDISGLNYIGLRTYSISGQVVDQNGNGIADVTISGDFGIHATTDANGNYSVSGVPSGGYTITPSLSGYTFNPEWLYAEISSSDVVFENFSGELISASP